MFAFTDLSAHGCHTVQWRRYRGGEGGGHPPLLQPFCYVWRPFRPSAEYICMIFKIMPKIVIGNSLLGDELAIAQQLISDILTLFWG